MRSLLKFAIVTVIATGVAFAAAPGLAQMQQNFPSKPIRLVVGISAGGQADTLARIGTLASVASE